MPQISRVSVLFCSVAALGACKTAPVAPPREEKFAIEVVKKVKCELYQSYAVLRHRYPWLKDWRAGFDLSLKLEHRGSASVGTANLFPFSDGILGLGAGGSYIDSALRQTQLKIKVNFVETRQQMCDLDRTETVTGEFGIEKWMSNLLEAAQADQIDNRKTVDTFGQYLEFYTEFTGGVTPGITIVRATGRTNGASATLGLSHKRTSTLNMAMTEIPVAERPIGGKRPLRVQPNTPAADQKIDGTLFDQRLQNLNIDR